MGDRNPGHNLVRRGALPADRRPAASPVAPRRAANRKVIEAGTRTPTTAAGEGIIQTVVAEVAAGMIGAVVGNARSVGAGWALAGRVARQAAVFSRAAQAAEAATARRVGAGAADIRG